MDTGPNGRTVLLDRAAEARAALVRVYDVAPPVMARGPISSEQIEQWTMAQHAARPVIEYFQSAVSGMRRDRLARRTAQAWFEAATMRWWDRCDEVADVEALAWSFLERLTDGRCPRRGPRQIRGYLDAIAGALLHGHSDDLDRLVALSKEAHRRSDC